MRDDDAAAKAAALWRKYLALTQDMMKLFDAGDLDMFMDLVEQRDGLIKKMQELPDNDYRESEDCQKMIEQIKPLDMKLIYRAKTWLNKSRHQTSAVRSYDIRSYGGVGGIVNREY